MKAELNVSVKGGNFDLNNKYLADMNVREAANIVFSMKQSDEVSEDVIRNEIRQKICEQYGTEFPLTIEKVSYTEAVKSSVGALVGTNGQCAFQVVLELAADRIAKQLPAPRIKAGAMKEEAKALAEEAVKALLPEGVSANVEILAFQSSDTAQEGAIRFCYHLQAGESAAYAERASDTFTRIMEKARKGQRWFRRFWRWRWKQICWKCLFHRAASPVRS